MAGPGLAPAVRGPACGGAVGDPCGSGVAGADTAGDEVAGADTAGDEVADGGGADVTGAAGGLACPCWPPKATTSHSPTAAPMMKSRPFITLPWSVNTPILQ
jgi:hypothetical protein